ncbi:NAD(P)H-hydrate epimerase [Actinobaculum massiliense]|uniref:NAD(P)H-hydrate epimerase n=1 Tax=Actinobaculum massiliense TaxID=202789 RepID=UPI0028897577|nr:NAD(P)H-hydrate epimerase [Actinobaculum massiliense]
MLRTYDVATVRAAEAPLLAAGEPLMLRAARALANRVVWELRARSLRVYGTSIAVFVGGGNNGGDALYAGAHLAARGAAVTIVLCAEQAHEAGLARALECGARVVRAVEPGERGATGEHGVADEQSVAGEPARIAREQAARAAVWIDGLLGIGARGPAREPVASIIDALNDELDSSPAEPLVVAVDTPSGIDAQTGALPGPALRAHLTVTMGAAKPGLVLDPARRRAGKVDLVDLAFERTLGDWSVSVLGDADVADIWPLPGATSHKYTRGVVGVLAGSERYPGAGILAVSGARAMGPGYVRYLGDERLGKHLVGMFPDVVCAEGRVQAYCVGSGNPAGGEKTIRTAIDAAIPIVIDAGSLCGVAGNIATLGEKLPETAVLMPHAGEASGLLARLGQSASREEIESAPFVYARRIAELTGATVVLKGAVDVVAGPDGHAYAQGGAPGWRGVAGSGDVTAGAVASMLAIAEPETHQPGGPALLAAAALHVHARAAAIAAGCEFDEQLLGEASAADPRLTAPALTDARQRAGHPICATDIARSIPVALAEILG